jgi:DNA topoisomerase-1
MRQAAKVARLRYVTDSQDGIRRLRAGKGFRYLDAHRRSIRDPVVLARIRSLAIPPAWSDTWICSLEDGHLQATGRDARGRKQYRYHARWRLVRDAVKYEKLVEFANALPAIRRQLEADLALPGLARQKVVALVVRLIELTFMRIGNEKYARDNGSFGITTLRNRHVRLTGQRIHFRFRGKSGKHHELEVSDPRMARIIQRCRDLPGYELFQYLDDEGVAHTVHSDDVNQYLYDITGMDCTAKDFRTWAGTVLCAVALRSRTSSEAATQRKRNVVRAVEAVAAQLGNTPSVCRKCYIHPQIVDTYLQKSMLPTFQSRRLARGASVHDGLYPAEREVLRLLEGPATDSQRHTVGEAIRGSSARQLASKRRAKTARSDSTRAPELPKAHENGGLRP